MKGEYINETWKNGNIIEVEDDEEGMRSHRRNKTKEFSVNGTDLMTNDTGYQA